jgi:D-sedoheptulose 7-phosphate isomerase
LHRRIERELVEAALLKRTLLEEAVPALARAARAWAETLRRGHKILFCGNGGSAADSQHAAAELVVRLQRKRRALPALALTTDTSLLTAVANDLGYHRVFVRQIEALGHPGDLLVALSTSGRSANILYAARAARSMRIKVMALTGRVPNPLARLAQHLFSVPSADTQRIQENHITILHILCRQAEHMLLNH